jgi:hypothetical protein
MKKNIKQGFKMKKNLLPITPLYIIFIYKYLQCNRFCNRSVLDFNVLHLNNPQNNDT